MEPRDQKLLSHIRAETLQALSQVIDVSKPVAILEVPGHTNVGDLMIYAGVRAYLDELGVQVAYVSDVRRFDVALLRRRMPDGTVLLNGGGNLGDTWPEHQEFKERAATVLRDYPMVQLPQTAYFADRTNSLRANAAFSAHPNFTLMLRDTPSIQRMELDLPDVRAVFVPDMAFGWTPTVKRADKSDHRRTVVLARTDKESAETLGALSKTFLGEDVLLVDWHMTPMERLEWMVSRIPGKLSNGRNEALKRKLLYPLIEKSFGLVTHANLQSGMRLFADAELVVTDRLHAHVLATLMGIPNIAVDNSYGKVKSLFDDYTHQFSTSHFAEGEESLLSQYRNLRGE